jgi:hypothetical protein
MSGQIGYRDTITNGLILNLDAANYKSYPGSGTTWTDLSQYKSNGTLTNGPTFSSTNGGGIVFDGTNDFVSITSTDSLNQTNAITVEIMVNVTQLSLNYYHTFISKYTQVDNTVNGLKWILRTFNGNIEWYTNTGTIDAINTPENTIQIGTWYHVVGVYNGTQRIIYLNGTQVASGAESGNLINNSSTPVRIGASGYIGASEYLNGKVSFAKLYNRALTATEVLQNYNSTKARFGL